MLAMKKAVRHQLIVSQLSQVAASADRSGLFRRFASLLSWTMVAFALDKVAMLLIVVVLVRTLGAQDYGRLILAQGLVNAVQVFVLLGAGTMLARYIPAMLKFGVKRVVQIVNLCAIVVLFAWIAFTVAALVKADAVSAAVLELPVGSPLIYLMIGWVALVVLSNLLLTVLLSLERGRSMGMVSLTGAIISIVIVPYLSVRAGLQGAIVGLLAVEAIKSILLLAIYRQFVRKAGVRLLTPALRSDVPLLFSFGLPVFLQSALWAPTLWLAQFILKTYSIDGFAQVAVFGVANSILGVVILMSGLSNRAALPILSSLHANGDEAALRKMTLWTCAGQTAASLAIGVPLSIASPFVMASFGEEFARYWPVLLIMMAAAVVIAGQTAIGNLLLINGRTYFLLMTVIPWCIIVIMSPLLFSQLGVYALAWGFFAASVLRTGLFFHGCRNVLLTKSEGA